MGINKLLNNTDCLNLVVVGHVDHGKSTIIGRLLADTDSLPEGKLNQIRGTCRRNAKPFEYAFLLDALKDEQAQGITIDVARCFFKTAKRNYMIIDAPGHIEFLKNMVTGAARAEAALLVIDACEGVKENSKRHGYLLSMLGIKQIAVIINKMDLVDYEEEAYRKIVEEYSEFLLRINVTPETFIPVSGFHGDNIASLNTVRMPWYKKKTVIQQLDDFKAFGFPDDKPFRMPVQGVYKFTGGGDNRRIVAGSIETGRISVGDEIIFYPSGKKTTVKSLEAFNAPNPDTLSAGYACGFTMKDQVYIKRGELAVKESESKPEMTTRIKTNLFWLGKEALAKHKKYYLKLGTVKVGMTVEEILRILDTSELREFQKMQVEKNEVAECVLKLDNPIAFDLFMNLDKTSRFVIVDDFEIAGGGVIIQALEDQKWGREKVIFRNNQWEKSSISSERRAEMYKQKAMLILLTGPQYSGKRRLAEALEKNLFEEGKFVYFLRMEDKAEQLSRIAETIYLMLDAGMILIAAVSDLTEMDMDIFRAVIPRENIKLIYLSNGTENERIKADLQLSSAAKDDENIESIRKMVSGG